MTDIVNGELTAAATVWSRLDGGIHSKLAAAALATLAELWLGDVAAGCHVASAGWLLIANPLWFAVLPAPMNAHDGCCCCTVWCAAAGDWPRSARCVPERGWHGGNDAELTNITSTAYPTTLIHSHQRATSLTDTRSSTQQQQQLLTTHHVWVKIRHKKVKILQYDIRGSFHK